MRFALPITILALSSAAFAQNNRHLFYTDEDTTANRFLNRVSAATRINAATTVDVELLADVSSAQFRGVGSADTTTCSLTGQVYVVQDSTMATQDFFRIIVRRPVAPDGLPDGTAAGVIAQSANIQLPPPQGAGPGIAWQFTSTWTTPVTVPCETGYFVGIVLLAGTAADNTTGWTSSAFAPGATPPTTSTGDNPRVPAPKWHACRVDQPAGTASRTTSQRTLAIVGITRAATLNIGNVDGTVGGYISYGLGGLYPNATRGDGLTARIEDGSNAGGLSLVFMTAGFFPGGIPIAGASGALWTNPGPLFLMGTGLVPAVAPFTSYVPLVPTGVLPAGASVTFFGVTVDLATFSVLRLTNAQLVNS